MNFADMKQRLLGRHPQSRLTLLSESEVARIRDQYPDVPTDLISFLSMVGWGRIGRMGLMIYSGPIRPKNVYDAETADKLKDVVLIGDDFGGYCVGYDTGNGWLLGEVNKSGRFTVCSNAKTFSAFIEERFLS